MDALYNQNLQAAQLGQRIDLHQSKIKIRELQKIVSGLKRDNLKLKSKLEDQDTSQNMIEFDKVRNMVETSEHNYELSKNLCMRINNLAQEYRKQTEDVETFEDLIDSQEWLIDSCMTASKDFKRTIKKQLDKLSVKLKTLQDELGHESDRKGNFDT